MHVLILKSTFKQCIIVYISMTYRVAYLSDIFNTVSTEKRKFTSYGLFLIRKPVKVISSSQTSF